MKKGNILLRIIVPLILLGTASCTYYVNPEDPEFIPPPPDLAYIGSDQCASCHQEEHGTFINSGHPYKLLKVIDGEAPKYPETVLDYLPPYFSNGWEDASYVIGGFAWKYRFVDKNGYIYTGDDAQFNFQDSSVVAYHADEDPGTKKYTCGKCHTTGWKSVADGGSPQDGLPGMDGEFFAGGIQCEACHGMGSVHQFTQSKDDITINREASDCGKCHYRNEDHTIAASGGFIKHHEQYDEMIAADHANIEGGCVACHDPHVSVKHGQMGGIKEEGMCLNCHEGIKNPTHNGADCVTCHLPFATKSAVATNKYVGDVMTHIFKINPNEDGEMFNEDGTLANGDTGLTLGFD
jgi:predicted CXXCH cytochrome family protein